MLPEVGVDEISRGEEKDTTLVTNLDGNLEFKGSTCPSLVNS